MTTKLILFDLDDTLCDYAGARSQRLRRAFSLAFDQHPSADVPQYEDLIAESIAIHPHGAEHFPELLGRYGISDEAAVLAKRWYQSNRFHGLRLFADAVQTLRHAREDQSERRLGLITNGPADVQRAKIELLGVESLFNFVIISGEFGIAKPERAIFDHALSQGEATVEQTMFVGDSPEFDIAGAHGVGMRSVWVNRTGSPWKASGYAPDHEIVDLAELRDLLDAETR